MQSFLTHQLTPNPHHSLGSPCPLPPSNTYQAQLCPELPAAFACSSRGRVKEESWVPRATRIAALHPSCPLPEPPAPIPFSFPRLCLRRALCPQSHLFSACPHLYDHCSSVKLQSKVKQQKDTLINLFCMLTYFKITALMSPQPHRLQNMS